MIPQDDNENQFQNWAYCNMTSDKGKRPDENALGNLCFGMNEGRFMYTGEGAGEILSSKNDISRPTPGGFFHPDKKLIFLGLPIVIFRQQYNGSRGQ